MDNQALDPKYLALIQAGLGILAGNNGRQPTGAAIGQGLLGGVNSYQDAIQQQQLQAMRKQQMDLQNQEFGWQKDKYDTDKQQAAQRNTVLADVASQYGIDPNIMTAYPSIGEDVVKNKLIPKPKKIAFAPNNVAYDENNPDLEVGKSYAPAEKIDYNKPFLPDGTRNQAYIDYSLKNSKAGASNQTTIVGTDKKYGEILGSKLAEQDASLIDAARAAPDRLNNARNIKNILATNPITGTGAEWRLSANKALATAGLIDGTQVKNTEDLASMLASGTLDAIKTSGLGAGQGFTDKDRQFLERAKSGNIEINAGTLATLADLNERAAIKSIKRGNDAIRSIKADPNSGSIGSRLEEIPFEDTPKTPQRTVTLKDIQDTAKASGKSTAQVTQDLKAKGYRIGK